MGWTLTLRPNPKDPHPVVFVWDDGELICSDDSMLNAVERLAAQLGEVSPTPTGPFFPADLSVGHIAFAVTYRLAEEASLTSGDMEVDGEGWRWPALAPATPAAPGVVY